MAVSLDAYLQQQKPRSTGTVAWLDERPEIKAVVVDAINRGKNLTAVCGWLREHCDYPFKIGAFQAYARNLWRDGRR